MKVRALAAAAVLVLAHSSAHAVFFFFIPGSVVGAVVDGITGSEGEHCIGPLSRVGDPINLGGGSFSIAT